mgnify:CR=1 FL=1
MKEILTVRGGVFGTIILILLFTSSFWYLISPFYYKCKQLSPGITIEQVEKIMAPYLSSSRVDVYRGTLHLSAKTSLEGDGIQFATKFLDMRCLMTIEDDKVKSTEFYYD